MKKILLFLLLFLFTTKAYSKIDPYFGFDYQLPSVKEFLSKNHPSYDSLKTRMPLNSIDRNLSPYQSSKPSSEEFSYLVRTGAYLSERNRVGLEFSQIKGSSDGHVPDSLPYKYTQDLVYSNLSGTFAQELWTGFFLEGKAGWGWRFYEIKKDYAASTMPDSSRGEYSNGPLFGIGMGWNQKIWWKLSLAASINWNHHFYIDDDIIRSRTFSGNIGLNWGLHYHDRRPGKY
jgi:hypothetical protein